jgi:ubiquinone/menaquinone biosynthesis C-methylase UbiE
VSGQSPLIAREVEAHYLETRESERLSGVHGELERLRTLEILARVLPPAPAVIFDIGGAAGAYAFPLSERGYVVHLIDPVELHLKQAKARSESSGIKLGSITKGDARCLSAPSNSADAVLLLGPLYHLVERADRMMALREVRRIRKSQGVLIAAAISRFASLIDGLARGFFRDAEFRKIVANDLATGQHSNPMDQTAYFTTAYFHRPEELADEVYEASLADIQILAGEGPVWSTAHLGEAWYDPVQRKTLMEFLSLVEREPQPTAPVLTLWLWLMRPDSSDWRERSRDSLD